MTSYDSLVKDYNSSFVPGAPDHLSILQYAQVSPVKPSEVIRPLPSIYDLPAMGTKLDNCGWVKTVAACEDKHPESREVAHHWCHKPSCPVCWRNGWLNRAAERSTQKIMGVHELHRQAGAKPGYLIHVVFSPKDFPDPSRWDIEKERARVYNIIASAGIKAAGVVCHCYRITTDGKDAYREYRNEYKNSGQDPGDIEKKWDWIINHKLWHYCYWSPHWHIVGWGWLEKADEWHEKTKLAGDTWIYKNKGIRKTYGEVFGTLRYILSHTALFKTPAGNTRQCITYMGRLGNAIVEIEKDENGNPKIYQDIHQPICPKCNGYVHECIPAWKNFNLPDNECWTVENIDWENTQVTDTDFYKITKVRKYVFRPGREPVIEAEPPPVIDLTNTLFDDVVPNCGVSS